MDNFNNQGLPNELSFYKNTIEKRVSFDLIKNVPSMKTCNNAIRLEQYDTLT